MLFMCIFFSNLFFSQNVPTIWRLYLSSCIYNIEKCKTLSHRHGFTLFAFKNSSVSFFRAVSLASIYLPARTDTLLLQPVKLCHALIHRSASKKLSYHHAGIAPLLHFHTGIGSKNIDIRLNPVI